MSRRQPTSLPSGPALFSERPLLTRALDAALHNPSQPLSGCHHPDGPGAYLLLFRGRHPLYQRIAVSACDGISLASTNGWPIYAGSGLSCSERAQRHTGNLADVVDLDAEDFVTVTVPTETLASALMVEKFYVAHFKPAFNQSFVGGFASRPQGQSREKTQATAPFSVLHPGRRACSGPTNARPAELAKRVDEHITSSIPDWWVRGQR